MCFVLNPNGTQFSVLVYYIQTAECDVAVLVNTGCGIQVYLNKTRVYQVYPEARFRGPFQKGG